MKIICFALMLLSSLPILAQVKEATAINLTKELPFCVRPGLSCAEGLLKVFRDENEETILENDVRVKKYIRLMWEATLVGNKENHQNDLDCTDRDDCPGIIPSGLRNSSLPSHGGNPDREFTNKEDRVSTYLKTEPWSAAFICFAYIRCAEHGVDGDWHADYIEAMKTGELPGWKVFNSPVELKKGDLLCNKRKSKFAKSSHCEIVYEIDRSNPAIPLAKTIAGNKTNSLRADIIKLNRKGVPLMESSSPFWVIARRVDAP